MGGRVELSRGVPREVRATVREHFSRFAVILPPWCRRLSVAFDDAVEDAVAQTSTLPQYRRGTVWIRPGWLSAGERERREHTAHEVAHVLQGPIYGFVERLLQRLDPLQREALEPEWADVVEGVTSDIGAALEKWGPR